MIRRATSVGFLFSLMCVATNARADLVTIDFDSFTETSSFGGGIEDGFVIGNISGQVAVSGQYLGGYSPNHSIHHQTPGRATFEIRHALGELFELQNFQLGTASNSARPVIISGYLGGSVVGRDLLLPTRNTYTLETAPTLTGNQVDRLVFNLGVTVGGPTHIDDIVLETMSIPEPAASVLWFMALAAMLMRRRCRQ